MIDAGIIADIKNSIGPCLASPDKLDTLINSALSVLLQDPDFKKIVVDYIVSFVRETLSGNYSLS
jgi:hypothetical protein